MIPLALFFLTLTAPCDSCRVPVSIFLVRETGLTCLDCRFTDTDCEASDEPIS